MKIKEKLKKCITGVGIFFTTITTKVFATNVNRILENINVERTEIYMELLTHCKMCIYLVIMC